jgi:hypothetical protein
MWNTVHNGSTTRFRKAEEQAKISPVDVDEIIKVIYEEFSEFIAKPIKHKITESQIETNGVVKIDYESLKEKYRLADERDIVWMKFTKDNYLGVVADSNDINFDIPNHGDMYDETENGRWKYNTSGILIHYLGKEWDSSFVLICPIIKFPEGKNRHFIEKSIGDFLIEKSIPILDYYSHRIGY